MNEYNKQNKIINEFLYKNLINNLNEGSNLNNNINYETLYQQIYDNINRIFVQSFFNILNNLIRNINADTKNIYKSNRKKFLSDFYDSIKMDKRITFINESDKETLKNQKNIFMIPLFQNMQQNYGEVIYKSISNAANNKSINQMIELKGLLDDYNSSNEFKCIIAFRIKNVNGLTELDGNSKLFIVLGQNKKQEITEQLQQMILNKFNFDDDDDSKNIGAKVSNIVKKNSLNKQIGNNTNDDIFESKILLLKGEILLKEGLTAAIAAKVVERAKYYFLKAIGMFFSFFIGTWKRGTAIIGNWIARYESAEVIRAINRGFFLATKKIATSLNAASGTIDDTANSALKIEIDELIKSVDPTSIITKYPDKVQIAPTTVTAINSLKKLINTRGTEINVIKLEFDNIIKNNKKIAFRPNKPHNANSNLTNIGKMAGMHRGKEQYLSGALSDNTGKVLNKLGYIKDIFANGVPFTVGYYINGLVWAGIFTSINYAYSYFTGEDEKNIKNNPTLEGFIDQIIKEDKIYISNNANDEFKLNNFSNQNLDLLNKVAIKAIKKVKNSNNISNSNSNSNSNNKNIPKKTNTNIQNNKVIKNKTKNTKAFDPFKMSL